MITSASDYQTITPVGVINGGILPARDVAADGSARALRAEDLCFAIEAVNERNLYGRTLPSYGQDPPQPTLAMKRHDWDMLWGDLLYVSFGADNNNNNHPVCVNPATNFSGITYQSSPLPLTLNGIYPGSVLSTCRPSGHYPSFVLDGATVRGFFYDLSRADRLCFPNLKWYANITETVRVLDRPNGTWHLEDVTSTVSDYLLTGISRSVIYATNDQYGTGPYYIMPTGFSSATLAVDLPLPGRISSAQLVMACRVTAHGYGDRTETRDWTFVVTCPRTYRGVMVPSQFSQHLTARGVLTSTGIGFPDTYQNSYEDVALATDALIEVRNAFLVVWYDFRTEIRSLGWSWTPPT